MKLDELIEHLDYRDLINFKNVDISGISYNSKTTKKGDIFICLPGEYADGHTFAKGAVEKGAAALLVEHKVDEIDKKIPQVVVNSTRHKIADIADRFYSNPSWGMNLIGVTGTNGKTTVTHLIQKIFEQNNEKFPTNLQECGNISAGSVPVLLDYVNREGMLQKGDTIVLAGFGAGLTWGATVLTW